MKHSRLLIVLALLATFLLVYGLSASPGPVAGGQPVTESQSRPHKAARQRSNRRAVGLAAMAAPSAAATVHLPTSTPTATVASPTPTATPSPSATPSPTPTPSATPSPTFVAPWLIRDRPIRVFIDPGHGGPDAGAVHVGPSGEVDLLEKDVDLDISLRLAALLQTAGCEVLLARTDDRAVRPGGNRREELYARVDMANEWGADLFIDVHNNGHNDRSLRGTEVYYCSDRPYAAENRRLAAAVQAALVEALRRAGYETVNRGIHDDTEVYRGHMGVLGPRIPRPTQMVAILGESLFVTNEADAAQLSRPEIRQAIAQGYMEGIQAYLRGE